LITLKGLLSLLFKFSQNPHNEQTFQSTIKVLNSLQIKKYRQIHQAFLVEGEKICLESITAQWETLHF